MVLVLVRATSSHFQTNDYCFGFATVKTTQSRSVSLRETYISLKDHAYLTESRVWFLVMKSLRTCWISKKKMNTNKHNQETQINIIRKKTYLFYYKCKAVDVGFKRFQRLINDS